MSKEKMFSEEQTRELLKHALEEQPANFKQKFDEIMLSIVVDKIDEYKEQMAAAAFQEEADEPEEDDIDDEDFDFDDEDIDLEDFDFDDEDLDDDEEVSESYNTTETNTKESARLRKRAASEKRDSEDLKDDHRSSRRFMGADLEQQAKETQQKARVLDVKTAKLLRRGK